MINFTFIYTVNKAKITVKAKSMRAAMAKAANKLQANPVNLQFLQVS